MISRPKVPVICPSRSPIVRSTASLRRVPWGGFPDFIGTISGLRLLAPRPAALRCLRLAVPPVASLRSPGRGRSQGLDDLLTRRPHRLSGVEKTRSPRFLDDPCLHAPLSDPGGRLTPGRFGVSHAAFRHLNNVGSASISLSRLYHAAYRHPVYASQPGSPPDHATLGSGWWPAFAGSGLSPAGSHRRFPSWLSVYMTSPLTKLCLAQ